MTTNEEVAFFLLKNNYHLTALEFLLETKENGHSIAVLENFLRDPDRFTTSDEAVSTHGRQFSSSTCNLSLEDNESDFIFTPSFDDIDELPEKTIHKSVIDFLIYQYLLSEGYTMSAVNFSEEVSNLGHEFKDKLDDIPGLGNKTKPQNLIDLLSYFWDGSKHFPAIIPCNKSDSQCQTDLPSEINNEDDKLLSKLENLEQETLLLRNELSIVKKSQNLQSDGSMTKLEEKNATVLPLAKLFLEQNLTVEPLNARLFNSMEDALDCFHDFIKSSASAACDDRKPGHKNTSHEKRHDITIIQWIVQIVLLHSTSEKRLEALHMMLQQGEEPELISGVNFICSLLDRARMQNELLEPLFEELIKTKCSKKREPLVNCLLVAVPFSDLGKAFKLTLSKLCSEQNKISVELESLLVKVLSHCLACSCKATTDSDDLAQMIEQTRPFFDRMQENDLIYKRAGVHHSYLLPALAQACSLVAGGEMLIEFATAYRENSLVLMGLVPFLHVLLLEQNPTTPNCMPSRLPKTTDFLGQGKGMSPLSDQWWQHDAQTDGLITNVVEPFLHYAIEQGRELQATHPEAELHAMSNEALNALIRQCYGNKSSKTSGSSTALLANANELDIFRTCRTVHALCQHFGSQFIKCVILRNEIRAEDLLASVPMLVVAGLCLADEDEARAVASLRDLITRVVQLYANSQRSLDSLKVAFWTGLSLCPKAFQSVILPMMAELAKSKEASSRLAVCELIYACLVNCHTGPSSIDEPVWFEQLQLTTCAIGNSGSAVMEVHRRLVKLVIHHLSQDDYHSCPESGRDHAETDEADVNSRCSSTSSKLSSTGLINNNIDGEKSCWAVLVAALLSFTQIKDHELPCCEHLQRLMFLCAFGMDGRTSSAGLQRFVQEHGLGDETVPADDEGRPPRSLMDQLCGMDEEVLITSKSLLVDPFLLSQHSYWEQLIVALLEHLLILLPTCTSHFREQCILPWVYKISAMNTRLPCPEQRSRINKCLFQLASTAVYCFLQPRAIAKWLLPCMDNLKLDLVETGQHDSLLMNAVKELIKELNQKQVDASSPGHKKSTDLAKSPHSVLSKMVNKANKHFGSHIISSS